MSIYSRTQRWKIGLALAGFIIIASTLVYSGLLVRKIAREERKKVELWADAIKNRAQLVKVTQELFMTIEADERKKAEILADATMKIITSEESNLNFYLDIIERNNTIPTIVTFENNEISSYRNLPEDNDSMEYVQRELENLKAQHEPIILENKLFGSKIKFYLYYGDSKMYRRLQDVMKDIVSSFISETVVNSATVPVVYSDASQTKILATGNIDSTIIKENKSDAALIQWIQGENEPIKIDLGNGSFNFIFYKDSDLLKQLKFFPIIQLSVISLFLLVAYFLFSTARRSEQDRVWVGMSKETAHQLGTPLSSLIGWLEILKAQGTDEMVTNEIANDIQRLQTVAERFSKVGSVPELKRENLLNILSAVIRYMEIRTSDKIKFTLRFNIPPDTELLLSKQLFEWVIENLFRNAVDAIHQSGNISVEVNDNGNRIVVDVIDSGKGIEKKDWKTIFRPGFTTKKRGWGLGLSLAKRIIDDYHKGRIYVKSSEPGETVFRIVLPKA